MPTRVPDLRPYDKQRYRALKNDLVNIIAPKGLHVSIKEFAKEHGFQPIALRAALDTHSDIDPNRAVALSDTMHLKFREYIIKKYEIKLKEREDHPLLKRFEKIFAEMREASDYKPPHPRIKRAPSEISR